eukprot:1102758-Lingulodinium_polyedra.AAC.1
MQLCARAPECTGHASAGKACACARPGVRAGGTALKVVRPGGIAMACIDGGQIVGPEFDFR